MLDKISPRFWLLGSLVLASPFVWLGGCSSSSDDASGSSANTGSGASTSVGTGGQGGAATTTGVGAQGGAAATTGTGGNGGQGGSGGSGETVRFIAMGDGGTGSPLQYQVAQAVKMQCDARGGCDFALYLGDNIYNSGVDSVDDTRFNDYFELPYQDLNFPFYITLGNHDYGNGGAGLTFMKGQYQVDYTMISSKWVLPDFYYNFTAGDVEFFSLDTNKIFFGQVSAQQAWLDQAISTSTATWKIAFGHHTYVSNGKHGNAGTYEGIPGIPIVSGKNIKDFVDDSVCGLVDMYLCGHDHNRQWLQPTCGTEFIVSGTAAKSTGLEPKGTPTFFENDQGGGFVLVEITGNQLVGTFYNENGVEEFTRTVTK